jgi:SAM-dependent methyltransferase
MSSPAPDSASERSHALFSSAPFPRQPLEDAPFEDWNALFLHDVTTARYRRHGRLSSVPARRILDVGCGSGWKTLMLAAANPGAMITAIDPSVSSVELARLRMMHHCIKNVECRVAALSDAPGLGTFDYINCDELIYLLPDADASTSLSQLRNALAPGGILRFNLHSRHQREGYFRGQALFKAIGLMDGIPGDAEVQAVRQVMLSLKEDTNLRGKTWIPAFESANAEEHIRMNYLLVGDKGHEITDLFHAIQASGLSFISMVNWDQWRLERLFSDYENLPAPVASALTSGDPSVPLRLFELLHPVHRKLDAWVGRDEDITHHCDAEARDDGDMIHLHPVFRQQAITRAMRAALAAGRAFGFTDYVKVSSSDPIIASPEQLGLLAQLWDGPCSHHHLYDESGAETVAFLDKLERALFLLRSPRGD